MRTEYIWDGTQLIYENNGSREMMYYYDADNRLIGFIVNGSTYYYVRNVQGDIIKILDGNMEEVVEYKYDTWGNVIGMEGSDYGKWVGSLNPFRYRGYYYDDETGMYYLQSRYYNPEWIRYLNSDSEDLIISTLEGFTDKNLFIYCDNNPNIRVDDSGEFWHFIIGAAVGAIINSAIQVATNIASGNEWYEGVGMAAATGAASGLLAASGVGLVGQIVGNAAISAVDNTYEQLSIKSWEGFDFKELAVSTAIGGITGAIGGSGAARSNGAKNVMSAGKALTKRVKNAVTHKNSSRLYTVEINKAIKYYYKSTKKTYNALGESMMKTSLTSIMLNNYNSDFYSTYTRYR